VLLQYNIFQHNFCKDFSVELSILWPGPGLSTNRGHYFCLMLDRGIWLIQAFISLGVALTEHKG
jgi:hypothetical protein